MAGRYGMNAHARLRNNIKASAILTRIQAFILEEPDPHNPRIAVRDDDGELTGDWRPATKAEVKKGKDLLPCVMTAQQLRAGLALLGKVIPDLKAMEITIGEPKELEDLDTDMLRQIAAGILPEGVTLQ